MNNSTEPEADRAWMETAIELSRRCPPSTTAYSVGAVIVGPDGHELSHGFSREVDHVHAEESALAKLEIGTDLTGATLYSTLEPCTQRRSRPHTCTQLILNAGIGRVVIAWREPSLFVAACQGVRRLQDNGVTVKELHSFADQARAINAHLLSPEEGTQ
ncbi:dCMP deaminase [Streptomyces xiamenensis]|uniref:dCMP deaminase n=1 Tax=Streptomyces xiamenensis TaxID=408015 RepID=UPI0036E61617